VITNHPREEHQRRPPARDVRSAGAHPARRVRPTGLAKRDSVMLRNVVPHQNAPELWQSNPDTVLLVRRTQVFELPQRG